MDDNDQASGGPRLVSVRMMDIVVALILLGASAVVMTDSIRLGLGWGAIEGPGAGYFPFYIGLLMAIASLVNLVRALGDTKGRAKTFVTKPAMNKVLAVLGPLVLYVIAVKFIGIYVASAIYIALFMWYFGHYPLIRGALVGLGVAVALFFMFEVWFLVPLPKGPLEDLLGY
jgi:hypothetical protein